jgi:hypothetical protein
MRLLLPFLLTTALVACAGQPDVPPSGLDTDGTPVSTAADTSDVDAETAAAFGRIMEQARAEAWHERPFGEIVQAVGYELLGARYQDGLLDVTPDEALVVNLAAFDCVLYVENVLALARGIAQQDYGFETYVGNLEDLRYRGGELNGYCSRLHYFTDWIHDNDQRGRVEDITEALGGDPFDKTLDFMSEHRDAYPRLAGDSAYACIVGVEDAMRGRTLFYVPEADIAASYEQLQAGDLIATATDIDGLDVTHTGFVYKFPDGRTGFIHASLSGEVKISDDLASYIEENSRQIGIIVARPIDPRTPHSAP